MHEFDEAVVPTESHRKRDSRQRAVSDALLGTAAATGRPDAAGPAGLLKLQRQVGNAGTGAMMDEERSPVHDVIASSGEPLDRDVRADMESSLGSDLSDVRVHTDDAAHESAQAVQAKAYTVGSHVVFQRDAYDPASDAGRHTLAHELTHVVQQRSGPVDGTEAPGGIKVSDPSDRFEREASTTADRVLAGGSGLVTPAVSPAIQREEVPEEEAPSAQTYVQRQPEEEEPEEEAPVQPYVQRQEETEEEPV